MREWHSKEDRKGLEQICVSFHKMCSSVDPLVHSEMLGRAALAQPVMGLGCLEMSQLWASLSQQLHSVLWGGKRETSQTFKEVPFSLQVWVHLPVEQTSSACQHKLKWQGLQEKTLQI